VSEHKLKTNVLCLVVVIEYRTITDCDEYTPYTLSKEIRKTRNKIKDDLKTVEEV